MINNPSESQVVKIWQYQLLERRGLLTEGGEPIEIIYPGRTNDDQGADFRDAVMATSQGLIKGDIEVHVRSSGWRDHGHDRDAIYNRVILHVVLWCDTKTVINLQNGREVSILALHKYLKIPASPRLNLACVPTSSSLPCGQVRQRLTTQAITASLDRASEERFLAKTARFQAELTQIEASQSLYQGIMGALGYSKNKLFFLELARRLPLQVLESAIRDETSAEECLARLQALLLGSAGLLPPLCQDRHQESSVGDRWPDKLEKLWVAYHYPKVVSDYAWHWFKVRPNNSPFRRLIAMSYLIIRYRGKGIMAGLISQVKEASVNHDYQKLEKGLLVTTDNRWASQLDFGKSNRMRNPVLLGRGRAAEIIVNVLLPFTLALSQLTFPPELGRKAFQLYRGYPKLALNSVEKHMVAQLGLSRSLVNSAQRQQGLIHIYQSRCTQGRCSNCSLSRT